MGMYSGNTRILMQIVDQRQRAKGDRVSLAPPWSYRKPEVSQYGRRSAPIGVPQAYVRFQYPERALTAGRIMAAAANQ
jgi:hypothetical protein